MGNYALSRFTAPNAGVSVSELGPDISTTANLGQAVENIDTHAANKDAANTFTGVQTFGANIVLNALFSDAAQVTVASAGTFPLPTTGNNVNVTGTTAITDFSGPASNGVVYKLQWSNASPGSVTSGNHAKLNGNFSPAQNNILYLYWDGTNAWEIGRYTATSLSSIYKVLGSATATSSQDITSTTTPGTDITGLTVTETPDGTHDVYISGTLADATNNVNPAWIVLQKAGSKVSQYGVSTANRSCISFTYKDAAPAASSATYKLSAYLNSAGTISTGPLDTPGQNILVVEQKG